MSASTSRQSVVVGIFVVFGVILLAGGILTIGDLNDTFTRKLVIHTTFREVGGLKKGDNIWFSGLKVGVVRSLDFDENAQVAVEMAIDRHAAEHIRSDAKARVGSDGLIGNKLIILFEGTPGVRPIQEGDVLAVGETLSPDVLMATLQENNKNLLAITGDLKTLTAKVAAGEGSIGLMLTDDTLYNGATATMASLQATSAEAQGMTRSLGAFTAQLNRPGQLPYDLVTDREMVPSLRATAADASKMMTGLSTAMTNPDSSIGTLLHSESAGADLGATMANLNRSTALLAEDLEAMQSNFLLRGFFKKQEKEAKKAKKRGETP